MKTPFQSIARAKRKARRRGNSQGRQGLPSAQWSAGPVPYLDRLHAMYDQNIKVLDQKLRIAEGQSITTEEEDVADKQSQEYQIKQLDHERSRYEEQLSAVLLKKTGENNENPTGKAARHRHIPIWLYVIALTALAIGEFFVTLPAVEVLLNDEGFKSWIITGSFSALSILGAHIIGLTLKIEIDREQPQPGAQKWGVAIIGLGLMLVILLLSAVRSKGVNSVPVKFGMSDKVFGTLLFFLIQATFIMCAIALSYYNHSEIESELSRTKRNIKKCTNKIRRLSRARLIPDRGNLTPEKRVIQVKAIHTHMGFLESEYRELCAIYREANILGQKIRPNEPGPGLIEKPLFIPDTQKLGASNE